MIEYYFLFFIGFLWIVFATIQDLRQKEVANWLNFSLIGFALAYRAFYALEFRDYYFLWLGVLGFGIFFIFANLFYYTRAFAGGDAKLLMALGLILPFENYSRLIFNSLSFIFILFLVGALYSLFYSSFIIYNNWQKFNEKFKSILFNNRIILFAGICCSFLFLFFLEFQLWVYLFVFLLFFDLLYIYLRALDSCMIMKLPANKLIQGDWLEENVRIGNRTVKKSVHGLSFEDIKLLKKYKKSVFIKQGIPFVPAFFIAYLIMVFSYLVLGQSLYESLISLFFQSWAF